jgi:isopentenyl-diphosphate delta-isomerase
MLYDKNNVIVVNEKDEWLGSMEKLLAHKEGVLHRAFSVFVVNDKNELLLQQRAEGKYHSGGLWSNTCCSHPAPGESTTAAAHRRLQEEMGFDCDIEKIFELRYKSDVGNELIENEYDHIYIGYYNGTAKLNSSEAKDAKFIGIDELCAWMKKEPQAFTAWFHLAIPRFIDYLTQQEKAA